MLGGDTEHTIICINAYSSSAFTVLLRLNRKLEKAKARCLTLLIGGGSLTQSFVWCLLHMLHAMQLLCAMPCSHLLCKSFLVTLSVLMLLTFLHLAFTLGEWSYTLLGLHVCKCMLVPMFSPHNKATIKVMQNSFNATLK